MLSDLRRSSPASTSRCPAPAPCAALRSTAVSWATRSRCPTLTSGSRRFLIWSPGPSWPESQKTGPKLVRPLSASRLGNFADSSLYAEPGQGPTRELLRQAAVESIVLLKNEAGVLPLSPTTGKIAVIGPNALRTPFSGGGSASLLSTFNISILDGLKSAVSPSTELLYHQGVAVDLYLPTSFLDSAPFSISMFNEDPSLPSSEPIFTTISKGSYILFNDGIPRSVNLVGWATIRASFTPLATEDVEFGLAVASQADFYVDGRRVIENSEKQVRGNLAFNTAAVERRAVVSLVEGATIEIEIRFSNFRAIPPSVRPSSFMMRPSVLINDEFRSTAATLGPAKAASDSAPHPFATRRSPSPRRPPSPAPPTS